MPSLTVEHFSDVVPLVSAETSVAEVLQLLSSSRVALAVVLDGEHQPVGVASLRCLMAHLLPGVDGQSLTPLQRLPILASCALEPVKLVPLHWNLDRIYQTLSGGDASHWILVDELGNCHGLVDQKRWWAFWAGRTGPVVLHPQGFEPGPNVLAATSPSVSLGGLGPLLDYLPLPLMVLTSDGKPLIQNGEWRHQLVGVQRPEKVWQKIAMFLSGGVALPEPRGEGAIAPAYRASLPLDGPGSGLHADHSWEALLQYTSVLQDTGSCQQIPNSSTCVCLCGMKETSDRVWQFSGTFLGHLDPAVDGETPRPSAASPSIWLILAQDVTEQNQVAKELAAKNADLVQLNRLKDEFLACISHELRTPLTAVLGLSNLLKDQMVGSLNERQERYARLIYQSGRHLMCIVNDILDLTRIETGQLELTMAPLAVESVCVRALAQARQAHVIDESEETRLHGEPKAVPPTFTLEIQPEVRSIVADELRLRQMLANLLSNALKFTEEAGQFGLRVEEWDGWVAFTVWDTGIGIPQNQQSLIFQKFQQLEHPLTRQFEGTGLGLVLTQRLAWLHGGDVTFTSTEGQGSQFTLLLPPDPSLRGVKPRTLEGRRAPWPGHHLILLVEAVPQYLDDMRQQLGQMGYRLAIARSGTEALEKARQLQPLMIFLNPLLPQLSGWDVLTLLRSDEETRDIPVVVTGSRGDRGKAFSHGVNGFLSVPVQPELLQQTIHSILLQLDPQPRENVEPTQLTILHLRPAIATVPDLPLAFAAVQEAIATARSGEPPLPQANPYPLPVLADLLRPHPCRVLEVDDLDQADLLARVWKPHLVLLDGVLPKPLTYLRHLSHHTALAALPLITLSPENTQAAHQMQDLLVFPCLTPLNLPPNGRVPSGPRDRPDVSPLLAVMGQAAGRQGRDGAAASETGAGTASW